MEQWDETGLSAAQAASQKAKGLQNTAPPSATKSVGQICRDNICTRFNLYNVLIACALAAVGAWPNMLFILVVACNTLLGIAQELHAKRLVDKLSLLSAPSAHVIRDGVRTELPLGELVLGDVVELDAGCQVCADAVLLHGAVEVNEALLTGESEPVAKTQGAPLLSGSSIVSGRCLARVVHVGAENYAAKLTQEAQRQRGLHSELLGSMRRVTRFTGWLIPPLGLLLLAEALLLRGEALDTAVVSTAAALLGMLPKGLVLLISVSLAAGTAFLARKKVLVQELFALETLAHADTLCLDKTGTLTQGRMQVESVWLSEEGQRFPFAQAMGSFLHHTDDNNATFAALQRHFALSSAYCPAEKIPFSAQRKWSAVRFAEGFSFVVGAPERLAPGQADARVQAAAQAGKRVLLAGYTRQPICAAQTPQLRPLAYIVIADPLRPEAAGLLSYFAAEGLQLKLLSGDSAQTAAALAAQAGLPHAGRCIDMSGVEDEAAIARAAQEYSVFARVSPRQKKQLVAALQKAGHSVAMVGDGVNDLPALRQADCSISVGDGSDAARQTAQLVLLDGDLSALRDVLGEGRRAVNNCTRAAGVFFVKTIYSALLAAACVLLGIPFPFLPIQITLIDLFIEGYPGFFLSFQPQRGKISGRFLPAVLRRAVPNAVSILLCFLLLQCLPASLVPDGAQRATLLYFLVGAVSLQALCKACQPFDRLRVFLCATSAAGFYAAALLLRGRLGLALPDARTLGLLAALVLLSFCIERALTALLRRAGRPASCHAGRSCL